MNRESSIRVLVWICLSTGRSIGIQSLPPISSFLSLNNGYRTSFPIGVLRPLESIDGLRSSSLFTDGPERTTAARLWHEHRKEKRLKTFGLSNRTCCHIFRLYFSMESYAYKSSQRIFVSFGKKNSLNWFDINYLKCRKEKKNVAGDGLFLRFL